MKLIVSVIVAILMWTPQSASALCVQGDCTNGHGTDALSDGSKYVGEFREGVRTGRGLMTYSDGAKYVGDWRNDKPHGKGTLISIDNFEYSGEFANGVRHGQGTLSTADGKIYVGQWQNDVPHGQGRITYPGKEEFVGQFENGRRNGQGEVIYADGTRYKGQWVDDLPNGQGIKMLPDGMQYSGEFKNGLMHGRGTVVMPDGSQIKIQWQSDVFVQKEEQQPETAFLTADEKGDWYTIQTPGAKQELQNLEPSRPAGNLAVSSQELSAAVEAAPRQEIVEPVETAEQIFPQVPEKEQAAVEEQTQTEAVNEIQTAEAEELAPEAILPAKGEQASDPKEVYVQTSENTDGVKYASIAKGANIRSGASLTSEVLWTVPSGYPVAVLEQQADWFLVEDFRERKGWVFAPLLTEPGTVIIKVYKGNLRHGPSLTDDIIMQLDHGTVMSVVETREDWLQVSDSEKLTGWLHRKVIWP